MIAPTARGRKRGRGERRQIHARRIVSASRQSRTHAVTGSLAEIIMPPNFRQATALLDCDKIILRWPGPFSSGFLSPQPPGAVGIGPVRRIVYPHLGPTRVGPFSFWGWVCRRIRFAMHISNGRHSETRQARARNHENPVGLLNGATCRRRPASDRACRDCRPGRKQQRHRRLRGKCFPAAQSSCRRCRSSHPP
jgi:hypothetical protein